jgi:hypothetical protein
MNDCEIAIWDKENLRVKLLLCVELCLSGGLRLESHCDFKRLSSVV